MLRGLQLPLATSMRRTEPSPLRSISKTGIEAKMPATYRRNSYTYQMAAPAAFPEKITCGLTPLQETTCHCLRRLIP